MDFSLDLLEQEHLIGRLKVLELLERQSPYRENRDRIDRRFAHCYSQVPSELQPAALALFASVLYFPRQMMDDAWRCLWTTLQRHERNTRNLEDILLLELDRDLIRDDFYRANAIGGRLQYNLPWRSTHDIVDALTQLEKGEMTPEYEPHFLALAQRSVWLLLIDVSISGISASSELDRLRRLQGLLGVDSQLLALIQIATDDALRSLDDAGFSYLCAIRVPQSAALTDENYNLIRDATLRSDMFSLCHWFAKEHVLPSDYRLARMSKEKNDPDIAHFGFGKRGWSIVTHKNAPNNSLPPLWFRPPKGSYDPPFERLDSRIGPTWAGRRDWLTRVEGDQDLTKRIRTQLSSASAAKKEK